jgi:hypothetical protein
MSDILVEINEVRVEAIVSETEIRAEIVDDGEVVFATAVEEGPAGLSAYGVAVAEGFVGTRNQWLASLVGPQGPSGSAGYGHTQNPAATSWIINHNLGYKPVVQVYDTGSQEIEAEIAHLSLNTVSILLTAPTAGFARLI